MVLFSNLDLDFSWKRGIFLCFSLVFYSTTRKVFAELFQKTIIRMATIVTDLKHASLDLLQKAIL